MKLFGWGLIVLAGGLLEALVFIKPDIEVSGHWIMGFFFGVLHLAYGMYLYLTEQRKNAT